MEIGFDTTLLGLPRWERLTETSLSEPTELCEIMGRHGSDKGHENVFSCKHNYTQYYHWIFEGLRTQPLRIFELGLGTNNPNMPSSMGPNGVPGASLRGWREFFPRALVFGADVDKDILFWEDRIQTFYCDQTSPAAIRDMWQHPALEEPFDIIVEDGLHEFSANVCFFEHSFYKVKLGGYFIIEDVTVDTLRQWDVKLTEWRSRLPMFEFAIQNLPNRLNSYDNILVVARRVR